MHTGWSQQGLLNWINRAPSGSSNALRRAYGLARIGFPLGLFSHFAYLILFWYLDQPVMAVFNIFSVALLGWGTWAAVTLRDIKWPTLLTFLIEVPLHAALATYYMGLAPFFLAYLLFPILLLPLLPYFDGKIRLGASLANGAIFVVFGTVAMLTTPARPLSEGWNIFFFLFNAAPIMPFLGFFTAIYATAATAAEDKLAEEFDRAERLLHNILPAPIAARLKDNPQVIADEHPQVSVLFADIVNFTATSESMSPSDLVTGLNTAFSRFDVLVAKHGCEKIKTIGDSYMAVAGLSQPRADHAQAMVALALDMIDAAEQINASGAFPFRIRIGINSGPVIAGVIGEQKFAYDLWGDTVNVAARMESSGRPGLVQITEATRAQLGPTVHLDALGDVQIKGKGAMATYAVTGRAN